MKNKVNQSYPKSQLESALLVATLALTQSACNAISIQGNINDTQDTGVGAKASSLDQIRSLSTYSKAIINEGAQVYQGKAVSQLKSGVAARAQLSRVSVRESVQTNTPSGQLLAVDPGNLACSLWFRADKSLQGGSIDCTGGAHFSVSDFAKYLNLGMDENGMIQMAYTQKDNSLLTISTRGENFSHSFNDGLYHYLQATVIADPDSGKIDAQLFIDDQGPYLVGELHQANTGLFSAKAIESQFPAIFGDYKSVVQLLANEKANYKQGLADFADRLNQSIGKNTTSDSDSKPTDSKDSTDLVINCGNIPGYAAGGGWNVRLYSSSECSAIGGNSYGNGECLDPMGGSFSAENAIWNVACPGTPSKDRLALIDFETNSCIGTAVGIVRLFTSAECKQLNGTYYNNGLVWGVSADLGECLVIGGGSYSAILGSINQRCSKN